MKKIYSQLRTYPLFVQIAIIVVMVGAAWFGYRWYVSSTSSTTQYQTAQAEKGTLVTSVSASGTISQGSRNSITTQAGGIISAVYVKDGDTVAKGDKIALITPDNETTQRQASAWASYLSAKNAVDAAKVTQYTLQSDMFDKWDTFYQLSTNSTYQNSDGSPNWTNRVLAQFHIADDDWLAAEAKYKAQDQVIAQTQASLTSAWMNYSQLSSTLTAPASGVVNGLSIAPGMTLTSTSSSSSSTTSVNSQSVGTIIPPNSSVQASVNLTEVDVVKVKTGMKVTMTLDAFPDKTFTGKVVALQSNGTVSSGVTTYPATIQFDSSLDTMFPNMGVTASIITKIKNDVILVPSAAVQTTDSGTTVRVMRNGTPVETTVSTGDSNDTDTEIVSGIKEGDVVVTGTTSSTSTATTTSSPFGGFGGLRTGGGAARIR